LLTGDSTSVRFCVAVPASMSDMAIIDNFDHPWLAY